MTEGEKIDPKTLAYLETCDAETLARIWNILNEWRWPADLPGKPEDFDELPHYYHIDSWERSHGLRSKYSIIDAIIGWIAQKIDFKTVLRYYHIHNLCKTEEQFERWWNEERICPE